MAEWKYACKTIKGMNLDLKLISRGSNLKLTNSKSGAGKINPTQLMALSDILQPVQELQIQDAVERIGENVVRLPVILKNKGVKEKYNMHQLGIYAEDPDEGEILYIVLQSDSAEEIPSSEEMKDFTLEWYINLSVANTQDVTIVIDETCVLTMEQADAKYVTKDGGDISETTAEFTQADTRENIESGEKLSAVLGKVKKFFTDLKKIAFSGNYNDLINKPVIPAETRVKGDKESSFHTGNVTITPANIGAVNKDGDTINNSITHTVALKFTHSGEVAFFPNGLTGGHARGLNYRDSEGNTCAGIGALGSGGVIESMYIGVGRYPYNDGLSITSSEIKWKNSNVVTEASGTAPAATKASRDSDGNVIKDTYANKSIYGDTTVNMGRAGIKGTRSFCFSQSSYATGKESTALGGNHNGADGPGAAVLGGGYNTASGSDSIVLGGDSNTASGNYSTVSGGSSNVASGFGSVVLGGSSNVASGDYAHAEGGNTKANEPYSHSEGKNTTAGNYASHACGKFNKPMQNGGYQTAQVGDVFVVGNGTGDSALSNALRVTYTGEVKGTKSFQSSGADYAEHIKPWWDGNPDNEDRVGYFVTVKGALLHKADEGDYIAGITSGNPSVVGNADEDYYWKYERDEFNRIVMEDVPEEIQTVDEDGNPVFDEETHEPIMIETGNIIKNARLKLAEDYDPSLQESYVERKDRKEWDYVGMIGVIPVRDDGTCLPGQFCKCGQGGIATLTEERGFDTFYVIERISANIVSVELR